MKKKNKVMLVILIVIVLGGFYVYNALFVDNIIPAFLTIESGSAQVDQGNGFQNAVTDMRLSKNDIIKVIDGISVVTLQESVIVELEGGAEVSIKTLSKSNLGVTQNSGSTWHKFTKITGVDSYEVETPTSVATMRGTEFGIDYLSTSGDSVILVAEGNVEMKTGEKVLTVGALEKGLNSETNTVTSEDRERIKSKMEETLKRLKGLRKLMLANQNALVKKAISKYVASESEMDEYLEQIDQGIIDDREIKEKAPISPPVIDRFLALNDEIKKQQQFIEQL